MATAKSSNAFSLDMKLWAGHRKGGRNRERKCRIPRISPPALCTKAKVAKGGRICGTLQYLFPSTIDWIYYVLVALGISKYIVILFTCGTCAGISR